MTKLDGKLYKSCMCLILSQSRRCLYIALSLSVSACSCVRTRRVLFVLPMYEELQPGQEFFAQTVRDNTNIIDRDDNWNLLLYKEAYHIKRLTPFLNNGLKASRELRLFS